MDREALAEQFKLNITPVSNNRCRELKPKCSTHQNERGVVIWTRKQNLAPNVYVDESTSGESRVVKQLAVTKKTSKSELAVIGTITKATETQKKKLFVEFKGWFSDEDHIYLVMEYCHFGHILYCFQDPLSESEARSICQQLLEAVEVLHGLGIVHRDIKPQNVLVAQKSPIQVKLADFGISKLLEDTQMKTGVGTFGYSAPEVWGALEDTNESSMYTYTAAVDIFSLGCLVYSVLTGNSPFPGNSFKSVADYANGRTEFPEAPLLEKGVSLSGRSFILRLLSISPKRRPKATADLIDDWIVPRQIERPPAQICGPETAQVSEPTTCAEHDDPDVQASLPVDGGETGITGSDATTAADPADFPTAMDFMSLQLWNLFNQAETPEDGKEQVRIYLENGADPNILHRGYSALHLAVMAQGQQIKPSPWLKTLLRYGANPNLPDKFGRCPIHSIIANPAEISLEWLGLLLKYGANPNLSDNFGEYPLYFSLASHAEISSEQLDLLLKYEADPKLAGKDGQSSIHIIVATMNNLFHHYKSRGGPTHDYIKTQAYKGTHFEVR